MPASPPPSRTAPTIGALLPATVVAREARTDLPDDAPFPGEEHLVAGAVAARRRELVTARRCAREALSLLGHPPVAIGAGAQREPLWPAGTTGSITHCPGYRAAAVARTTDVAAVGIDAEPAERLPPGVAELVVVGPEPAHLADLRATADVPWDRVLFSAKEAVYKAWSPLTGRWLGFEDAHVTIDPTSGTIDVRTLVDAARLDGGPPLTTLTGRFLVTAGLVLTAVTVPR